MNDDNGSHSHLNEETRTVLSMTDEDRIQKIWQLKHVWIPYDRIKEVFAIAEGLLARAPDPRLPCILLYGDPNSGKTASLREYEKRHPIDPNPDGEHKIAPVVSVEVKGPDIRALYLSVLQKLGSPYDVNKTIHKLRHEVLTVLPQVGTRQLLLDEVSTAISGPDLKQKAFMVELKYLLNVLKLTVFAAGTEDARSALAVDPQMESRFEMRELERWSKGTDWLRLLKSFERRIPLQHPSFLYRPSFAEKLHTITEGLLGELAEVLMRAAVLAIKSKNEKIDSELLEKLHLKPPSIRRASARGVSGLAK